MGYHSWGSMGGTMLFGGLFSVLLLILIVAGVVWLIRAPRSGSGTAPGPGRPAGLDILEERYAKGEIARDEYLQKKRDILSGG